MSGVRCAAPTGSDAAALDSFDFLSSAMHIVRKAIAKKAGLPVPRPDNTPESNPFVFAVIGMSAHRRPR